MFHHIVAMQFDSGVDADFHARVEHYCARIREDRRVLRYVYGPNSASRHDGLTHVIVSAFPGAAEHDAYQVSPVHVEMKSFMLPRITRIVVCELDDGVPLP